MTIQRLFSTIWNSIRYVTGLFRSGLRNMMSYFWNTSDLGADKKTGSVFPSIGKFYSSAGKSSKTDFVKPEPITRGNGLSGFLSRLFTRRENAAHPRQAESRYVVGEAKAVRLEEAEVLTTQEKHKKS
tara:strand:+ start:247 stop:630 length:384 start_codon:yes stop_codon:yes gene_type:complete